ncbi:unnamed protein product [Urochloa humidicola]
MNFLLDPSLLNHGSDCGSPGPMANAKLFYGWQFVIAAGQQIGCKKEVFLIRSVVLFATKKKKMFSTSSPLVYSRVSFGSLSCTL